MIRFYSLFVTDDNLLASPYISSFNTQHDITLHRGQVEKVNFLVQVPLTGEQHDKLKILFDPLSLSIDNVKVKPFNHETLISMNINPKEIGAIRLGFEFPDEKQKTGYHFRKIPLTLKSVSSGSLEDRRQGKLFPVFKSEIRRHY